MATLPQGFRQHGNRPIRTVTGQRRAEAGPAITGPQQPLHFLRPPRDPRQALAATGALPPTRWTSQTVRSIATLSGSAMDCR